jgi:hypothetical protein
VEEGRQVTAADHLRGPWEAVLSSEGCVISGLDELETSEGADISICRGSAIPVDGDWPSVFSGEDVIELWDDLEFDEAEIRWAQAQAMAAGLNAAVTE